MPNEHVNKDRANCYWCKKPTVSIFGQGRAKWCPDCEKDESKRKKLTIDDILGDDYPNFKIIDLPDDGSTF